MADTQIPTLITARLVLRPFSANDIDILHGILSEEGILRYFPRSDPPLRDRVEQMILGVLEHWHKRGYGLWAVESRSNGHLMGRCGVQDIPDTGEVEVDFLLSKKFWGQGFATEAARASLRYGFDAFAFAVVVGIVHPDNMASRRVLEKLGMSFVEQKQYFGMECCRYAIDRSSYYVASQSWGGRALDGST